MYCRDCGKSLSDNALKCANCGTRRGEGIDFCMNCGQHTSSGMEHCRYCGVKLKNVLPQKMKTAMIKELKRQISVIKLIKRVSRLAVIVSVMICLIFAIALIVRKEPSNIPDPPPSQISASHEFFYAIDYYDYYSDADADVLQFWAQGRRYLSYIVTSFIVAVASAITGLIAKSRYKKLLIKLKEVNK